MFLDLQLDRTCPGASAVTRRGVHVIQQTAVTRSFGFFARRPFLVTPLELQFQVVVLEGAFGPELAEDLAGDPDRGPAVDVADDGKDLDWVATRSDRLRVFPVRVALQPRDVGTWCGLLHPRRPAVEIGAVPQGSPAGLGAHPDDAQHHADEKQSWDMHDVAHYR